MGSEQWIETTFDAEVDLITGFPFKSEFYTEVPTDIRLLRGDNIVQGRLRWDGVKRWSTGHVEEVEKYRLREGDIVVAMDRPWIEAGLKYAAVAEDDLPCLLVQRVARLRGRETLDTEFLRYLVGSEEFKNHVLAVQTGTAVPHISGSQIREFSFLRPPLREQKVIAFLLGSLDRKIELNRRTNQTLGVMARGIFKSWFVDFDPVRESNPLFPRSFCQSTLGSVPEGWRITELGTLAEIIDCLHSKKPERQPHGRTLLQLNNILDNGLLDMSDVYYISEDDYRFWTSRMEAQAGDCVITNVGRVGAVAQVPEGVRAALGRNMTGLRCRPDFPYPTFLIECLLSSAMREEITSKIDAGTILESLNVRNIPKLRVIEPSKVVAEAFERTCRPLWAKMERNLDETRTLAILRDALLPKLLSGEIRAKQAEKIIGEAV